MPATYLLLRNNKQSGPHSLEALLQYNLNPHDLIWEEGRSAGWRYPFEVEALKPYINQPEIQSQISPRITEQQVSQIRPEPKSTTANHASHIYVSLPAGMVPPSTDNENTAVSLEAKAEALYQRVQAFTEGRAAEVADTRYARSLDDMKDEYGDWLLKQQQKKKRTRFKQKLLVAASVFIVLMTGFSFSKWMRRETDLVNNQAESINLQKTETTKDLQNASATFALVTDSFNTAAKTPVFGMDSLKTLTAAYDQESKLPKTITRKKPVTQKRASKRQDSVELNLQPAPELPVPKLKTSEAPTIQKQVRLSQQLTVNGTLESGKKEATVILKNNSSETLRSVAVIITYFKKDGRESGKETIHFQNVPPSGAPVQVAQGNRRAAAARFEIGTIIRADGSLYLIH